VRDNWHKGCSQQVALLLSWPGCLVGVVLRFRLDSYVTKRRANIFHFALPLRATRVITAAATSVILPAELIAFSRSGAISTIFLCDERARGNFKMLQWKGEVDSRILFMMKLHQRICSAYRLGSNYKMRD